MRNANQILFPLGTFIVLLIALVLIVESLLPAGSSLTPGRGGLDGAQIRNAAANGSLLALPGEVEVQQRLPQVLALRVTNADG